MTYFDVVTNDFGRPSPQHVTPNPSSVSRSTPRVITKPANPARTHVLLPPTIQDTHPSSAPQSLPPPRVTILKNPARARPLSSIQSVLSSPAPQSPPRITILKNPARARPLSSIQSVLSSPAPQSPPLITILSNPARAHPLPSDQNTPSAPASDLPPRIADARTLPSVQSVLSSSAPRPPPPLTIFNPARARPLPSDKSTPSSSALQSAPPITILTNPARVRPPPAPQSSQNIQNVSAVSPALKLAPAPIPKESAQAGVHPTLAAARAALKKVPPTSIPTPLRIIVHEPASWDERTKVHLPPAGHKRFLGVPAVDVRGKLREREFARHYPREYAAEESSRLLRSMLRNGSNLSTARCGECAC